MRLFTLYATKKIRTRWCRKKIGEIAWRTHTLRFQPASRDKRRGRLPDRSNFTETTQP